MLKRVLSAAAIAFAAVSAQADTLLSEDFSSVGSLEASGWVRTNLSSPIGTDTTGWIQGDASQFTSQAGADNAYAAADYNSSSAFDMGYFGSPLNSWLITPTFSTAYAGVVSFWAKSIPLNGHDLNFLNWGMSTGSSATTDFTMTGTTQVSGDWTLYTFAFAAQGPDSVGRFAIDYTGLAYFASYVGVDTLSVVNSIPEPSTYLMFGAGLLTLAFRSRRAILKKR